MSASDEPRRVSVLIEQWLPISELGIESRRERAAASALPPLSFLHVWWARRPLVACAGVILCSLLPTWTRELADRFEQEPRLASEDAYRKWVLYLIGIWGDPVAARVIYDRAKAEGLRVPNPFTYKQAYKNSPTLDDLSLLHRVLEDTWDGLPSMIDPTAGGGSIPYEAARYGIPSVANDLNAVAAMILRAGLEIPAVHGMELLPHLEEWGERLSKRCEKRLASYFPSGPGEEVATFFFARSVVCPRTGKLTPLVPNWWLVKGKGKEVAAQVVTEAGGVELATAQFKVLIGTAANASDPDTGTVSAGDGVSVWDGLPIDGDYIKSEARAGRMQSMIYAVAVRYPALSGSREKGKRGFRAPTAMDEDALKAAQEALNALSPKWLQSGVLPTEDIGVSNYDRGHRLYGMTRWIDFFSPRQLLVHGTLAEELQRVREEVVEALGEDVGNAVAALLGLIQGKALNYNAHQSYWNPTRSVMIPVFTKHNFSFTWTYGEFEGARQLVPWCVDQLVDSYKGIVALYQPRAGMRKSADSDEAWNIEMKSRVPARPTVMRGNAGDLDRVDAESQTLVCVDPPYYDNVMYAELSDFFGVWEQHTVGRVWPDLMPGGLADTTNEAVANQARFKDFDGRKRDLASSDYQAKMRAIFLEAFRILRSEGVLTVMFTHKRAEAWDTLGMALMEAGFEIATSWPVNTEAEQSLHQAKKNAASSTVMLVCRKRRAMPEQQMSFFEDLVPAIREAARSAVARFGADGITGVDLLLSTYGPVLSVISSAWPVYSSEASSDGSPRLLRPEEALDVARTELVELRRRAIVGRQVTFDAPTDFWLIAWETFKAEEFPYDEARRLALAVGGQDPESLAATGILKKSSGSVIMQTPFDRRRKILKPVQAGALQGLPLVDLLHGLLAVCELDGLAAAKVVMDKHGLLADSRFMALVQGALNALPRTKSRGEFVRPETRYLDALVTAYMPDVVVPADEPLDTLFGNDGS